jgi:Transposase, Mutator family
VPVPGDSFEQTLASASPDLLREMIREFAQRMMGADVEVRCNAGYGEVTPDRVNSRNGCRRREQYSRGERAGHPQAAPGVVLPGLPGAPAPGRAGAGHVVPAGRVDPAGREASRLSRCHRLVSPGTASTPASSAVLEPTVLQTATAEIGPRSMTCGDACRLDHRLRRVPRMSHAASDWPLRPGLAAVLGGWLLSQPRRVQVIAHACC